MPKEEMRFWQNFQKELGFENQSTLFIDDSIPILRTAEEFGIAHLITIEQPDTKSPPKPKEEFHAIGSFSELLGDL